MNMKAHTSLLLSQLEQQTQMLIEHANYLLTLPANVLLKRPVSNAWNALECIEHLNRYGDFYLPEISKRISNSPFAPATTFTAGMLGNYFVKSMQPKEGMKKMKTFRKMNPMHVGLDKACIEKFIGQQHEMLALLNRARRVDLNRTKTSISITKLVTLKLGDTFRFVIMHNQRHMEQALATVPAATPIGKHTAALLNG
jgi:hypothetical protein